ncbi:peptidoglycan-binding domain-containing protein [Loktanella sp. SALINAS62]|uniref:peptidoglycan-binding domain-containing protein n=1 Tax=Loktanella sp. SALINAS62 TaxID=2706124 RepID=UPI001B8DA788|nr:peptidoglycan-binding domain-containing protein [Loktanella sp. SALINAS62]MBS1301933.1 peptidoglycan-binding protein [Loktanella sp. SALINAS62]
MRQLLLTTTLICAATLASAQDAALIVGNADYANLPDVARADRLVAAGADLADHGFDLMGGRNVAAGDLFGQAVAFSDQAQDATRMVVALSGQFATNDAQTWFMGQDAGEPDDFTVGRRAILLQTALQTLARAPGAAVLMLGVTDADTTYDDGLTAGIGTLDIPSGVTVLQGTPEVIEGLMRYAVAVPGADLIATARRTRGITLSGFVPNSLTLIESDAPIPPSERVTLPPELTAQTTDSETTAWTAARAADTESSYARYLDAYPSGANAAAAVSRLADLRRNPPNPLRDAENALGLSADARRAIQRDLQIMGFDTRGIDGIFGPGTRGAITAWQDDNDVDETGFLTRDQIDRLSIQATARAQQREAEAAAARAELERRDRAYWEETGERGGKRNLRAYLDRFPDGLFAEQANERLGRANAPAPADDNSAAAAVEAQLAMDPISLQLVEARLAQLGLEPGSVDGQLDNRSRQAIRRYQRDRNLGATGYLDQATVSQMLVDAFR